MLVLTRRLYESVVIGDDARIKITVLDVRGDQVRFGIEAPRYVMVHRQEVWQRIIDEKKREKTNCTNKVDGNNTYRIIRNGNNKVVRLNENTSG